MAVAIFIVSWADNRLLDRCNSTQKATQKYDPKLRHSNCWDINVACSVLIFLMELKKRTGEKFVSRLFVSRKCAYFGIPCRSLVFVPNPFTLNLYRDCNLRGILRPARNQFHNRLLG